MKNISFCGMLIIVLVISGAMPCFAEKTRIAVISMERVFEEHHKTREANILLKERLDEMEGERQKLLSEAKRLRTEMDTLEIEAADGSLSEKEQQRKKQALKEKHDAFIEAENRLIRFDKYSKSELGEHMRSTQQDIVRDIRKTVEQYVSDRDILLVLDNSGKTMNAVESVIYFNSALDITDDIIEILNKK